MSSVVSLAEGSVFAGRYKVVRCLAAGGMGAVYEVVHQETVRRRALKVMHPHLEEHDDFRKRFQTEARIAGQVESAYIVDVFDAGVDETTKMPFLVMELLQGEELGKRLHRVGTFEYDETVSYLWQAALALDKTHKANIVHRDLKPANLFLCEDDDGPSRIKVLDFGIAKIIAEGGTQANATQAMGTPLYMAPEQFKSKSKVCPATDIHALGLMAYTMLVGASYWSEELAREDNAFAFAVVVMHGPSEPPTARALRLGIRLPAAFDEWFACATAFEPAKRFGKATVAIKALAQALGVEVPTMSARDRANTTGLRTNPLGQTTPGQTPARQTDSARVSGASSSSGPQGTVVLEATPAPAEPGTHASGYGLSSSDPRMSSVPTLGRVDKLVASTDAAVQVRKQRKTIPLMIVGAMGLVGVGIVVVSTAAKNSEPTAVVPMPVPSATMALLAAVASAGVPAVVPESPMAKPEVSASATPKPAIEKMVLPAKPRATTTTTTTPPPTPPSVPIKPVEKNKALDVGGRK